MSIMHVVPTYLKIILPIDVVEEDSPEFPIKSTDGETIEMLINIKTAKVSNWLPEYGSDDLWCKVVDEGTYILYNEDMEELDRIEGYVPNELIPEHDGYGDYIDMHISKTGYVTNWYNQPKLDDFEVDFDMVIREMNSDN